MLECKLHRTLAIISLLALAATAPASANDLDPVNFEKLRLARGTDGIGWGSLVMPTSNELGELSAQLYDDSDRPHYWLDGTLSLYIPANFADAGRMQFGGFSGILREAAGFQVPHPAIIGLVEGTWTMDGRGKGDLNAVAYKFDGHDLLQPSGVILGEFEVIGSGKFEVEARELSASLVGGIGNAAGSTKTVGGLTYFASQADGMKQAGELSRRRARRPSNAPNQAAGFTKTIKGLTYFASPADAMDQVDELSKRRVRRPSKVDSSQAAAMSDVGEQSRRRARRPSRDDSSQAAGFTKTVKGLTYFASQADAMSDVGEQSRRRAQRPSRDDSSQTAGFTKTVKGLTYFASQADAMSDVGEQSRRWARRPARDDSSQAAGFTKTVKGLTYFASQTDAMSNVGELPKRLPSLYYRDASDSQIGEVKSLEPRLRYRYLSAMQREQEQVELTPKFWAQVQKLHRIADVDGFGVRSYERETRTEEARKKAAASDSQVPMALTSIPVEPHLYGKILIKYKILN